MCMFSAKFFWQHEQAFSALSFEPRKAQKLMLIFIYIQESIYYESNFQYLKGLGGHNLF